MNLPATNIHGEVIPRNGIYRVLICRPNHRLGNVILMTPLVAELEQLYKGVEIDIVVEGPIASEVFETYFSVKNVYCLPKRGFKHPISFLSLVFRIRKTKYDLIIDPCLGSGFSRILTRIFKGARKLGYDRKGSAKGLTHVVPGTMAPRHMAKRPINLICWYSPHNPSEPLEYPPLDIRLTAAERETARSVIWKMLDDPEQQHAAPSIGIFADATGRKRYSAAWWEDFIDAMKRFAPQCAIIEIIPMHGRSMLGSKWPGYYSTSIRRMGAVMAGLDLMISADCGVMHLAVASRVPTIGMFSVTDANIYGPYGTGNSSILTQGISAIDAARHIVEALPSLFGTSEARLERSLHGQVGEPGLMEHESFHGAQPC